MNNYSEFYKNTTSFENSIKRNPSEACCSCGLTSRYNGANVKKGKCKFCRSFQEPRNKGSKQLIKDLNLQQTEKLGLTLSGGKDSIFMVDKLCKLIGADHVVAFNHYKTGLVHPLAQQNIVNAQKCLGFHLEVIRDDEMQYHFRRNLSTLLDDPRADVVRMVLCTGCRYGITKNIYKVGNRMGIKKFVSGASYLELAPFKEELIKDPHEVINYLSSVPGYCYDNNLEEIKRDSSLKYKNNLTGKDGKGSCDGNELFDFDQYFSNDPEAVEEYVIKHLDWQRPERSWHFDCLVEEIKDVFYYGLLGYTETDFKLSSMVRYGLLSREEADHQLAIVNYRLEHGIKHTMYLLDVLGCSELKPKMVKFYKNSKYLKGDMNDGTFNFY